MKLNQRLAVAVIAVSAGMFGASSAAFAESSVNTNGAKTDAGNAAAVIQVVDVYDFGKSTNISAAAGAKSAAATAGTQIAVDAGTFSGGITQTGSAAASNSDDARITTTQGGNTQNQATDTTVRLGL